MKIYTGQNDFDYASQSVRAASSSHTDRPHIAIDASLLGNIQAKKITLIGTEKGVGINAPQLTSDGAIALTAAGDITLRDIQTKASLQVKGPNITQAATSKKLLAEKRLHLEAAQGHITLQGEHVEAHQNATLISQQLYIAPPTKVAVWASNPSPPTMVLKVAESLENKGTLQAASLAPMKLQSIQNTGTIDIQGDIEWAVDGLHNAGEIIGRTGAINLTTATLTNTKNIYSSQHLSATATEQLVNTGTMVAVKDLQLTTQKLTNTNTILSGGNLRVATTQTLQKLAALHSAKRVSAVCLCHYE